MERQNPTPTAPMTKESAYEPPRATFVPLEVEERLSSCDAVPNYPGCGGNPSQS